MLTTVLTGAFIAISFSAPPGPVAMETIRRGVRGGFSPALLVQLGSCFGDFMWFSIAFLGLGPLAQIPVIRGVLAIAGVLVLLYLGGTSIRDALKSSAAHPLDGADSKMKTGAFRSGMAISIANPMAVAYWLSVGGALVAAGVAGTTPIQTASFAIGFISGTVAWAFGMALAIRWSKRIMSPAVFRMVNLACGGALLVFGFTLASQMLGSFS